MIDVGVIGGGAAGFFAAISVKQHHPQARVTIYEASNKILAKVKISGGGRCNVTNGSTSISELVKAYPRGGKLMKKLLREFSTPDTREWFESRGVPLYMQDDGRVFPKSDNSQSIIDCLLREVERHSINLKLQHRVTKILPTEEGISLKFQNERRIDHTHVIVATGGSPKRSGLEWLEQLGHEIESPVPSLFTFNIPDNSVTDLMGLSVSGAKVSIQGTKFTSTGPLLITHWGMSGPAVLKLSAEAARELSDIHYTFGIRVNWLNRANEEMVREEIGVLASEQGQKQIINLGFESIPQRLWAFLLDKAQVPHTKKASELSKKEKNRLVNTLFADEYAVKGKTTFKEEFVTCGGISLSSVHDKTMESKAVPGLYFTGEVLDVDGITGGYNFQAAWTTGFVVGRLGVAGRKS